MQTVVPNGQLLLMVWLLLLHIQVRCGQFIAVVDTAALAVVVAVAIAVAGAADVAVDTADGWCCCNDSLTAF